MSSSLPDRLGCGARVEWQRTGDKKPWRVHSISKLTRYSWIRVIELQHTSRRGRLVERHWQARPEALGGRRARGGFAYQAYVPSPIADEEFFLTSTAAAAAAEAETAVRNLNEESAGYATLEVLARQLLRAESVASSRIEHLVVGHRRLARAAFDPTTRDVTAESVLGNIAALEEALEIAVRPRPIASSDMIDIHKRLLAGTRDAHLGGVVRTEQNWIGGAASSPRDAEFVPPPPADVPGLLDDLCRFLNREDIPATIQAAIAHAQFETIHPFHDGNGRVGRALTLVVLRRRGLSPQAPPPVSLALAADPDRYVSGLTSFRNADEEDWYAVFVAAVQTAAGRAHRFAGQVAELQHRWRNQAGDPRSGSGAARLIELLPASPFLDIRAAHDLLGGSDERARQAILRLERAGVLRRITSGDRNRVWESVGLFDLLDRFERDLGRAAMTPRATQ
jgi:Fic family protein